MRIDSDMTRYGFEIDSIATIHIEVFLFTELRSSILEMIHLIPIKIPFYLENNTIFYSSYRRSFLDIKIPTMMDTVSSFCPKWSRRIGNKRRFDRERNIRYRVAKCCPPQGEYRLYIREKLSHISRSYSEIIFDKGTRIECISEGLIGNIGKCLERWI